MTAPNPTPLVRLVWTEDNIARFWRDEAHFPDHYFTYRFGGQIVAALRSTLRRGGEVLDYGCGVGFLTAALLEHGYRVTGTDLSPEAVEETNRRYRGHEHFRGAFTIDRLLEQGRRYDIVLVVEVLEHLDDVALQRTFDTLTGLLKPDGIAVVTTPNDEDLAENDVHCPQCGVLFNRWQHVRTWDTKSLGQHLTRAGFKVLRCFTTDFTDTRAAWSARALLSRLKRLLGLGAKQPHLVCVCQPAQGDSRRLA